MTVRRPAGDGGVVGDEADGECEIEGGEREGDGNRYAGVVALKQWAAGQSRAARRCEV